jgi:hypothetical protein
MSRGVPAIEVKFSISGATRPDWAPLSQTERKVVRIVAGCQWTQADDGTSKGPLLSMLRSMPLRN